MDITESFSNIEEDAKTSAFTFILKEKEVIRDCDEIALV